MLTTTSGKMQVKEGVCLIDNLTNKMSAILTCLSSNSSGNGYIIQADTEALMLEAGVPFKEWSALADTVKRQYIKV